MRLLGWILVWALATCLGCGTSAEPTKLLSAKELWNEQTLENYTFEYARSCECLFAGESVVVTVQNGVVSELKLKETGAVLSFDKYGSVPTIPELFDEIDRASREADVWSVTYDADRGYPRTFSVDWNTTTADDEVTYTLSALSP